MQHAIDALGLPRAAYGHLRPPQIVVANVDNENMMADPSGLTPEFCAGSALIAQRMLWFAEPGDIVLLPSPPSVAMKRYLAGWKHCDPDEIRILSPDPGNHGPLPLGAQNLLEPRFVNKVRGLMGNRQGLDHGTLPLRPRRHCAVAGAWPAGLRAYHALRP